MAQKEEALLRDQAVQRAQKHYYSPTRDTGGPLPQGKPRKEGILW